MKLIQIAKAAVISVCGNRLRSALTMLGLIIGISSVILLVGIGDGSNRQVGEKMKALGGDIISMYLFSGELHYEDMAKIKSLEGIEQVAPSKPVSADVSFAREKTERGMIEASDENYLTVRNLELLKGRNLTSLDREEKTKVCVIGSEVESDLFKRESAIGQKIKLGGDEFTVVGVLADQGESMGLYTGGLVLVPFSAGQALGADQKITSLYVKARDEAQVVETKQTLTQYLVGEKQLPSNQFSILSQDEMRATGGEINETMTLLLGGIASISLIVAGIGVMNVMLVSVTERVREIGIKKALGARRSDILLQFLTEALLISLFGGALGIAGGLLLGGALDSVGVPFVSSSAIVGAAVGASTAIGLIFGIFPAYRASRMNPIDALRQE